MKKNLIVFHAVEDHQLPLSRKISIQRIFDYYDLENTLKGICTLTDDQVIQAQNNAIKHYMERRGSYITVAPEAQEDQEGTVIELFQNWMGIQNEVAREYAEEFLDYLKTLWDERGGDDDFFDYLPSISDVFLQICRGWEYPDLWKNLVNYLSTGGVWKEVGECSLYQTKF